MNNSQKKLSLKFLIIFVIGGLFTLAIAGASTSIETSLDSAIQYIQKIIFTDDGGNSGTTGVIIDGTDGSINTNTITLQNGATVSNIKAEGDMGITNNNSLATTEAISGFVNTKLAGFSTENFYLNDGSFNSSNGELTLVVDGTGNQVIDLDGRYLESFTEDDPEVGTLTSGKRCIENGGVIDCTEDEPVLNETDPVFMANSGDFVNKSDNQTIYGDKTFKDTFVVDDDATIEQDLTVNGNFYVNGTETVINSTNVQIDDKKVILGEGGDDILVNGA